MSFNSLNIKSKMLVSYISVIIVLMLAVVLITSSVTSNALTNNLNSSINVISHIVSDAVKTGLKFEDEKTITDAINVLTTEKQFSFIQVENNNGEKIFNFRKSGYSDLGSTNQEYLDEISDEIFVRTDVISNGEQIGTVILGLSLKDRNDSLTTANIYVIIMSAIIIVLFTLLSLFLANRISKPLQSITTIAEKLGEGDLFEDVNIEGDDEIGRLADSFRKMINSLRSKAEAANKIAKGNIDIEVSAISDKDVLGHAISAMRTNLQKMFEENSAQDWLKTGLAELNEKMRGEQDVNELAQNVINYIASYMDIQVGAIYLKNESDYLDMAGSFAFTKRKNLANKFKIGESLVGQSALEKKDILINNVPDDYIKINSGLGESTPLNVLVTPFLYEGQVKGVVELGSFHELNDLHIQFLRQTSENVAIAFHTAESRVELKKLLEESQQQSEELQSQQEELRVTNEELEEQTQSLKNSEGKLKEKQENLKKANQDLEQQTINLTERQEEIEKKNAQLEVARTEIEVKAGELELTSKYKSEFLANMSHELRTPLNSVLILSKLLLDNKNGNLEKKQIDFAQTINSSGTDLLGLINEILDLSKIESGKMIINIEDVSLTQLPSYIQQNLQHLAEEKNLYLKVELEKGLPEKITTDRQRVEQVVKNLMSNAIKFTGEGGITVNIQRPSASVDLSRSGLEHKKAIAISVSDTGLGIPEDKQKLIFEAFQQADGTTSRKFGGTGLGLSISREIVKILGGEIHLQSETGKGSTFTLYLPESVSAEEVDGIAEIAKTPEETAVETKKEIVEKKPVPKKEKISVETIRDDRHDITADDKLILVVEDNLKFAKILFDFTREKGFKCLIAGDGEAGLQMATQYLPSAVILDVGLPRMDGWTVMERLKNNAETRHIPVYFISGQDKKIEAMKMGAIGYLTKPVNAEDINTAFSKIEDTVSKDIKKLLVVEDDETMRNSIMELIGNEDVTITSTGKGGDALKFLHKEDFDCMVLDLGLSDISGFDLLKKISTDDKISDIPIIIYTGKELTKKEETGLHKYAKSIIVKGAKSPDRLLDEVSLFLHRVESDLPEEQKTNQKMHHDKEEVFKDKKILIADDDVRNIFALSSILEEKEIQLATAENGIEALDALKKDPKIDLVLMDIMMPEMDGYEAMGEIRKQKQFKKLPLIALTAKAMKGDRQKCIDAGANDYLSKPVEVEKLLSLLRVWLYK